MKKLMLIISLLSVLAITNAQVEEKNILSADEMQKNELKMPPEITEMVLTQIKDYPNVYLSEYDNKYWSQLENLQLGHPFPEYTIDNDTLKLSGWLLPFLFKGEPLFLARGIRTNRGDYAFLGPVERDKAERILNYEYKDSIVGFLEQRSHQMSYLIIRKDNKDVFVQMYNKATDEYFKNEYSFSEIINIMRDIIQKDKLKRAQRLRFSLDSLPKNELKMTPEITKMLLNTAYSQFMNDSDEGGSNFGIKSKSQLEDLHLGKPIPEYMIDINNGNLIFTDVWEMLVMSNGKPLFITRVKLEDDGQYRWGGSGSAEGARITHNYEHKDLIIGGIRVISPGFRYLIIRKDNKNIIVRVYNSATHEYFKEYNLREVIKQIKE